MFNKRRAVNGDALIVTRNGGYNQLTTKQQIDVVCLLDGTVVNVVCNVWKWYWPRRVTIRGTAIFHKRLMDKSGFDWFIFPITGAKVKFENFSVGDQVDVTLVPTAGSGERPKRATLPQNRQAILVPTVTIGPAIGSYDLSWLMSSPFYWYPRGPLQQGVLIFYTIGFAIFLRIQYGYFRVLVAKRRVYAWRNVRHGKG